MHPNHEGPAPREPAPIDEPSTDAPVPAESVRTGGGRLWWGIVGSVTLLAVVVAGLVVALQPSAPSSVDDLEKLLIAPAGSTTDLAKATVDPKASSQGARWAVSRGWFDDGHRNSGIVSLTQYQTADQAQAAVTRLANATPGAHKQLPGHPGAFFVPGPTLAVLGRSAQSGAGAGAKHTVVAFVAGTGESPDAVMRLLAEQLDRLP